MGTPAEIEEMLSLVDYRRRVARIYHDVREHKASDGSEAGEPVAADAAVWRRWADSRAELLRTHPQSPLDDARRAAPDSVRYFDHDPTWRLAGIVHPLEPEQRPDGDAATLSEEHSIFRPVGSVTFERAGTQHRLGLFWLDAYGGGLFLPFRDGTNGDTTYGGGRYLLDGAKSADLGSPGPGRLLLDFNYAYHPSCLWDPIWPCPLAPPTNRLDVAVEAGERKPAA